ncbi:MAG: MarR family transcriptional regulator [Mariprofundaceae bacterium]
MSSRSRNLGQIVQGIHIAQQNLSMLINRTLDPMGLNMSRLTVLAHFSNQPNRCQTITSITHAVDMNQPAVTKIVSYLISKGWLSTQSDSADARKKLLKISSEGLGLVIKAYGKLTPEIDQVFASLSDQQVGELKQGLKELNNG